jgi:hypothetical protein
VADVERAVWFVVREGLNVSWKMVLERDRKPYRHAAERNEATTAMRIRPE